MASQSPFVRIANMANAADGYDYGIVERNGADRRKDAIKPLGRAPTYDDAVAAMAALGHVIRPAVPILPPVRVQA